MSRPVESCGIKDGWLADDLRAYLVNEHPFGNPESAAYDADAPLFPGRYGMSEVLPEGLSREDIEPLRPMVADPNARVVAKTGQPDRRYVRADPHTPAIRCALSHGYKWSVPVNPAGLAKHYFDPALAALGVLT